MEDNKRIKEEELNSVSSGARNGGSDYYVICPFCNNMIGMTYAEVESSLPGTVKCPSCTRVLPENVYRK